MALTMILSFLNASAALNDVDINETFFMEGVPGSGGTALHIAILANRMDGATFLIEKGAGINEKSIDQHGGAPLHWAAGLGRLELAKLLIEKGADVNSTDSHGYTPLDATRYQANIASKAKQKIAELLRAKGAKHSGI